MSVFQLRAIAMALCLTATGAPSASASPNVGDIPPNEVGKGLDDEPVLLQTYAGKAIVISFWATWCLYCLKELPILQGIQRAAGTGKIQVIAINTESRDVFRRSARALSDLELLMVHDTGSKSSEAYGVKGIPHMVIIGRNGRVVSVYHGYDESALEGIVADINRALAVPKAASSP